MKRILVTGCNGMVGSYVQSVFKDYEIFSTDIDTLDVRNPKLVMDAASHLRPDIILHLAAATDVDRCEQEPDWAFQTNAIGTQNVVLACKKHNILLVYISTAGVFYGDKVSPYTEFDVPHPANIYGHSKLAGEHLVSTLCERFFIVRAGWMVGGGSKDKKFVGKMVSQFLSGRKEILAVNDKFGSPTFACDLLTGITTLIGTDYYGLYHMVNPGCCSRYEVALEVRRILKKGDVTVTPVSSAYFPLPAPRARSEAMLNYKLDLLDFVPQRPWQNALEQYLVLEFLPAFDKSESTKA
jgi:dTDP-4-dehydrorhamnose reductase